MNSLASFDTSKFYLGKLCSNNHEWNNTRQSLRYKHLNKNRKIGKCVECNRTWQPKEEVLRFTSENFPEIDINCFYLGVLCKRQHQWKGHNYSLRYRTSGACVDCYKDRRRNDPAYITILRKSYERIQQSGKRKAYETIYRKSEGRKQALKRWNASEKKRICSNRYRHSEKGKAKGKEIGRRRRAQKQLNHTFTYTKQQIDELFQFFDGCCAYCGNQATEIDHAIPVHCGGPDVLGNFLPSCRNCNVRKSDNDLMDWFMQQPFFTTKRWKKILKVLGKNQHNLNQLPLF